MGPWVQELIVPSFLFFHVYIYSTITYTHIKLDVEAASILLKPGIYRRLLV
jgi:hypothetical protein